MRDVKKPRGARADRTQDVRDVQQWYPQIYLACHTRHQRAASTSARLSGHDSSVLAHLDTREPMTAGQLARHLQIGASTLSATLQRLTTLGYVARTQAATDRRRVELRATPAGSRAMQATSVLDEARVAKVLEALSPEERRRALDGLSLLARASRLLAERSPSYPSGHDVDGARDASGRTDDGRTAGTDRTGNAKVRRVASSKAPSGPTRGATSVDSDHAGAKAKPDADRKGKSSAKAKSSAPAGARASSTRSTAARSTAAPRSLRARTSSSR